MNLRMRLRVMKYMKLNPKYAFQTVTKDKYDRSDPKSGIRIINVEKFLSMLV